MILMNKILNQIKCIPEDVLTFFYYSCSITVALLALTTIIFTVYNERIILKIEEYLTQIGLQESDEISRRIDKINSLLSSNRLYLLTIFLVRFIMFLGGFLWYIVLLNKLLNIGSNLIIDIFLILSGILVSVGMVAIPSILILLNRNKFIKLKKNAFQFNELLQFLRYYKSINGTDLIANIIKPSFNFYLKSDFTIEVDVLKKLKVCELNYIIELRNAGTEACVITFMPLSDKYVGYNLVSTNKFEKIHEGLFEKLSKYEFGYLHIFENKEYLCSLDLEKHSIRGDQITFSSKNKNSKSPSNDILEKYQKKNYNSLSLSEENKIYRLVRK